MKKIIFALMLVMLMTPICFANAVHEVEDAIPMDKWAHLGAGYFINDQLHRHTKMTPLERVLAVSCIAYAKERWADSRFDHGDLNATIAGALGYEIRF